MVFGVVTQRGFDVLDKTAAEFIPPFTDHFQANADMMFSLEATFTLWYNRLFNHV